MLEKKYLVSDRDEKYPPKLILFLSVDIQNSTNFKNEHIGNIDKWYKFFHNFFKQFPIYYESYLIESKALLEYPPKQDSEINAQIWKSLGDELIFQFEISHRTEITWYILSFKQALEKFHKEIQESTPYLGVKGTSWLAGFPVNNVELNNTNKTDFIGPSIDLGFRLSKHALPYKFVISVELAYLLLMNPSVTAIQFSYSGKEVLRGILKDKPYPIIWIKLENNTRNNDTDDSKIIPDINKDYLREFCLNFIKNYPEQLFIPFIDSDPKFLSLPEGYQAKYKKSIDVLKGLEERFEDSLNSKD